MRRLLLLLALLIVASVCDACLSYRQWIPANQIKASTSGRMDVLTRDGSIYSFPKGRVAIRTITGEGKLRTPDGMTDSFTGDVPLDSVALVQLYRKDALNSLLIVEGVIVTLVAAANVASSPEFAGVQIVVAYPGGGGSCPLAYSQAGDSLYLESETYVGGICSALERTATDVLAHARPSDEVIRVRIANEAPETHLTDAVQLVAVDHAAGTSVVSDIAGNLHAVSKETACLEARDASGRDVTAAMISEDNSFYESDLSQLDPAEDDQLRDAVTCTFARPASLRRAKLVVRCMNSDLGDFALNKVFSLRGPSKLDWYHQLAHEPLESRKLAMWMLREGGLEVSVWQHDHWVRQGVIAGVGGRTWAERLVELDLGLIPDSTVNIRLAGAVGLWKIDAVAIAFGDSRPVAEVAATLEKAEAYDGAGEVYPTDVSRTLAGKDHEYWIALPDQWVDLEFSAVPQSEGLTRTYVLRTSGHYYAWFGEDSQDNSVIAERILREPLYGSKLYLAEWLEMKRSIARR